LLESSLSHENVSTFRILFYFRVLRFSDQVSGCRDRAESIKPERLHEEFVKELEQRHPEWLSNAQNEPDWTCAAWSRPNKAAETTKIDTETTEPKDRDCPILGSIMSRAKEEESTFSFSFL
jgi:hypothetical protein